MTGDFPQSNFCKDCGQWWINVHYCGAFHPGRSGSRVVLPLTEEDVRRIVRDEIAKHAAKDAP